MTMVEMYERDAKPLRSGGYGDRHMTSKSVNKALRAGLGSEKSLAGRGMLVRVEVEPDDRTEFGGRKVRITVRGGDGFA